MNHTERVNAKVFSTFKNHARAHEYLFHSLSFIWSKRHCFAVLKESIKHVIICHIYVLGVLFSAFFHCFYGGWFILFTLSFIKKITFMYHHNIILMIFIIMNAFESTLGL